MFIAALFIIARTWKQPRCPSADKWIRKLWYIYTMEYYSAIKKNSFESVLMRWITHSIFKRSINFTLSFFCFVFGETVFRPTEYIMHTVQKSHDLNNIKQESEQIHCLQQATLTTYLECLYFSKEKSEE